MQDKSDLFRRILINTSLNTCERKTEFTKQQHNIMQQTLFSSIILFNSQSSDYREKINIL